MIRIAAAGDLHFGVDSAGQFRDQADDLAEQAELLLLAGDLTRRGLPEEAEVLARDLSELPVPVVAVLGNHDFESEQQERVRGLLEQAGVTMLEGDATLVEANGTRLGIAGTRGFGGGFAGANATDFGEPEMKAFVRLTKRLAERLEAGLSELEADLKVALMHYSPVKDTLRGEPLEIYPFLGSYLLAEAVDRAGADLVLHGHAHRGQEQGVTPGGVAVRNVAQHVIRRPYKLFTFGADGEKEVDHGEAAAARASA
jgi:Icc-related predicted phosphoesterase